MMGDTDIGSESGLPFEISLAKLVGKPIAEIIGTIARTQDNYLVFKITDVIFEDDTRVGIEAEHDIPYVVTYSQWPQRNLDDEALEKLKNYGI